MLSMLCAAVRQEVNVKNTANVWLMQAQEEDERDKGPVRCHVLHSTNSYRNSDPLHLCKWIGGRSHCSL